MRIDELINCPKWLRNARTENADVEIVDGDVRWLSGDFRGGDFRGGEFWGGDFRSGKFWGGNFRSGYFWGSDFLGGEFLGGEFLSGNFWDGNFLGGDFRGGNFLGGDFWGGDFRGGNFRDGNFRGGEFRGGNFRGGNFLSGNLRGGDFWGGNFQGDCRGGKFWDVKVNNLRAWQNLYEYQVAAAVVGRDPWVRMGCLWYSLKEWDKIGIRKSNPKEFPDNGSASSEERVRAFEFARATALDMAARYKEGQAGTEKASLR